MTIEWTGPRCEFCELPCDGRCATVAAPCCDKCIHIKRERVHDRHIRPDGLVEETVERDTVQPIVVVIPSGGNLSALFFKHFESLHRPEPMMVNVYVGPYVAQNMRLAVDEMLKVPDWQRMVVVETDMIMPLDALVKHALHTDPIVGSVYFQHAPPFHINCMMKHPERDDLWAHMSPRGVVEMLKSPGLWECDIVGLGCTSIRRDVLENWPTDRTTFRNEYSHDASAVDTASLGEISHDVYFCREARAQGHKVYIDTTILCRHLTTGWTDVEQYLHWHEQQRAKEQPGKTLYLPRRKGKVVLARH